MRRNSRKIPVVVLFLSLLLPSHSSASSNGEALVWKPQPIRPALNLDGNHIDISKKIKWYSWDVENKYFLSNQQPFSIRLAQEVKIVDNRASCTSVPVRVRRELSQKEVTDSSNQTLIQFFQADFGAVRGMSTNTLKSKPIIFTIDSSIWKNRADEEIQIDVPICADSIGKSPSELIGNSVTINLRIAYSTNYDENLNKVDPKCHEILGDKCMFYSSIVQILGINFSQSNLDLKSLENAYRETIEKEKDYLQEKPCEIPRASYDQQSNTNVMVKDNRALCDASKRNLDFLNSELDRFRKIVSPSASSPSKSGASGSASPTPTKSAISNPTIAKSSKKLTITCVKGKLTKKVTAVNPKCPAGFEKK